MPTIDVGEHRIAYERAGRGAPLVLLHGALSDARVWRPQIEGLAGEFELTAWDAPGAGRSSDPSPPFGLDAWADALADFLEAIDVGPAHVLGLSFGGSLALELYRRRPGAVRSLILADSYAGWKGSLSEAEVEQRKEMALRTSRMPPDELIERWLPELLTGGATPERVEELKAIMSDTHPAGLRLLAEAMAAADLRDVLPRIEVPTLLLWGEQDERSPLRVAEAMRESIPGAELVTIPGAGHDSNVEQPERFTAAVRSFLRAQQQPGAG
jgi:pimeloyl-ACP methyl ester carboxylesterase